MGYRFRGFFTTYYPTVGEAAIQRWPFCSWRTIDSPFAGIGVRCPDPEREADDDDQYEVLLGYGYAVEDELPGFSNRFPDLTFAFVVADCVGGTCLYTGYVVRDGSVLQRVDEVETGPGNLMRLLEPFGLKLRGGHFEPFVRGFWGER